MDSARPAYKTLQIKNPTIKCGHFEQILSYLMPKVPTEEQMFDILHWKKRQVSELLVFQKTRYPGN